MLPCCHPFDAVPVAVVSFLFADFKIFHGATAPVAKDHHVLWRIDDVGFDKEFGLHRVGGGGVGELEEPGYEHRTEWELMRGGLRRGAAVHGHFWRAGRKVGEPGQESCVMGLATAVGMQRERG